MTNGPLGLVAADPAAVVVRRATADDADGVLAIASKFISRSPFAQFVTYDAPTTRNTVMHALADERGVVFVLEIGGRVVGAIMGALLPLWFSTEPVAQELGWWVDDRYRGHGTALRLQFEAWAAEAKVSVVCMSDVVLDDATPAGTLYERAGYEMVERAWMKRMR